MNSAEIWDARGCTRRVTRNFAELPGPPQSAPARARELSPHWQGVASRRTYPRTNAQKDSELGMGAEVAPKRQDVRASPSDSDGRRIYVSLLVPGSAVCELAKNAGAGAR